MATESSIQVPDNLGQALQHERDRLPELLALTLTQPALPARVYRDLVAFLASNPTPEQIGSCGSSEEMRMRLATLLERSAAGAVTPAEAAELDAFEQIEHLVVMINAGNLACLSHTS